MGRIKRSLATLRAHPFIAGFVLLALLLLDTIREWFIDPIVKLNVERWAESKGADQWLSSGAPEGLMEPAFTFYYTYIASNIWPYLLGVATCFILFGIFDIYNKEYSLRSYTIGRKLRPTVSDKLPGFVKTSRTDYDLIPDGLAVSGTRYDDGIDIRATILYRNRSKIHLSLKARAARFELDGKRPAGKMQSGINGSIAPEKTDAIRFEYIRIYNQTNQPGSAEVIMLFGPSAEEMTVALRMEYSFKIISYPKKKGLAERLEADVRGTSQYYVRSAS